MATASIGQITMAYDDEGDRDGEPLVLVHGHPFNRSMWWPQVPYAARAGWRVIAPDLRGYGESTVVPGRTTLDVFARDIAGLLDHLGIERFVLGGLSMGGQIVMECLRLFPERVRGMLLADTSPRAETEAGYQDRHDLADRLLRDGVNGYSDEVLPKMVSPKNIEAMPEVARHVAGMMRTTSAIGAAAALRGRAERPDYVDMLRDVDVPAVIVVGSEDEFTPVSEARLLNECTPRSTLTVIDGAGHMPNLERADEFNDTLGELLQAVTANEERT